MLTRILGAQPRRQLLLSDSEKCERAVDEAAIELVRIVLARRRQVELQGSHTGLVYILFSHYIRK
jgi:hypothetical protein